MGTAGYVKISKANEWPVIYKRKGKISDTFMVDTASRIKDPDTGVSKRIKRTCKSLAEAKVLCEQYSVRKANQGSEGFKLTKNQQTDAELALRELEGTGLSLLEACKFAAEHHNVEGATMTIAELVDDFMAHKLDLKAKGHTRGTRDRTLGDYRSRHGLLASKFGNMRLIDFDEVKHFDPWLRRRKSPRPLINCTKVLFNHAVDRGYLKRNPIKQALPEQSLKKPEILRPNEWRNLLLAALHTDATEDLLAFVTLGLYCGLRPESELGRLSWDDVIMSKSRVFIDDDKTKVRFGGEIDIPKAAMRLLRRCKRREGMIVSKNHRNRWDRLRESAGVKDNWVQDVMRHTCATMTYANTGDKREVRKVLRHVDDSQLRHYVKTGEGLREEAQEFFDFKPPETADLEKAKERSA